MKNLKNFKLFKESYYTNRSNDYQNYGVNLLVQPNGWLTNVSSDEYNTLSKLNLIDNFSIRQEDVEKIEKIINRSLEEAINGDEEN